MNNSSDEEFRKLDERKVSNDRSVDEQTTGFWYYANILCCGCFGSKTDESDDKPNDEFIPYSYGSNVPIMNELKTSHITTDKLVTTEPIPTSTHSITKSTDEPILMDNIPILNNEESKEQIMTEQISCDITTDKLVTTEPISTTNVSMDKSIDEPNKESILLDNIPILNNEESKDQTMTKQELNNNYFVEQIVFIQRTFRVFREAKSQRNEYLLLRDKVIFIQRKFRTKREFKNIKTIVNELLEGILILIQTQFTDYEMESESIQSIITASIGTSFNNDLTERTLTQTNMSSIVINNFNEIPIGTIVAHNYRIVKMLGHGSYGHCYEGIDIDSGHKVAVKVQMDGCEVAQMFMKTEIYCYEVMENTDGFPELYFGGEDNDNYLVVTQLLNEDLGKLFSKCSHNFSPKTIFMLAEQLLIRLNALHEYYFVHKDLKPENIMIDNENKLYLIDFGLSESFIDPDPESFDYLPNIGGNPLFGTVRYCSINAHLGSDLSPRDDMECLAYTLIYFCLGYLPWDVWLSSPDDQHYDEVRDEKMSFLSSKEAFLVPPVLVQFLKYCQQLEYESEPHYTHWQQIFYDQRLEYNFQWDYKLFVAHIPVRELVIRSLALHIHKDPQLDYRSLDYRSRPPFVQIRVEDNRLNVSNSQQSRESLSFRSSSL